MATNESFNRDPLSSGDNLHSVYSSSFSSGDYLSTMLCVGSEGERGLREKYGVLSASDSSASSSNNSSGSSSVSKSKRTQSGEERTELKAHQYYSAHGPTPSSDSSATVESRKVRKEKLGERITALQQLVSPFGKTDTASVLHEAMGYIRFLHEQVQVLSSPYLQRLPSSAHLINKDEEKEGKRQDLRNRGLCLVPVSFTAHVANCNGADLWSPAMGSTSSKN